MIARFEIDLEIVGTPRIGWNDLIEGYEVRGLEVAVRSAGDDASVSTRAT